MAAKRRFEAKPFAGKPTKSPGVLAALAVRYVIGTGRRVRLAPDTANALEVLGLSYWILAALFLAVAAAYSAVGLGGASAYAALMVIFGVGHGVIPTVALILNLVVTSVGSLNFFRYRHARFGLIAPFLVTSLPAAYLGGTLNLPQTAFQWLLLITLILLVLRIYLRQDTAMPWRLTQRQRLIIALLSGAVLGAIAGVLGIGGGIYLVPLILVLGLGTPKEAAACGAIFVWLNSISGLAARLQHHPVALSEILPLAGAVLIGAAIGSQLGASRLSARSMERWLGLILILAIVLLAQRLLLGD